MHGDFSRDTFDPARNITGVLLQQGRLLVDADWNEQSALLLHQLRSVTADVIGWHGGPKVKAAAGTSEATGAFALKVDTSTGKIQFVGKGGRYYVDGHLLSVRTDLSDPQLVNPDAQETNRLVFLDVWESEVLASDLFSDPALLGQETAARLQLRFAVRVLKTALANSDTKFDEDEAFRTITYLMKPGDTDNRRIDSRPLEDAVVPLLTARVPPTSDENANDTEDQAGGYRGLENQLYRVEVHRRGAMWDPQAPVGTGPKIPPATFKWSRENGSIVYPIASLVLSGDEGVLTLAASYRDVRHAVEPRHWIELLAADQEFGPLVQVKTVTKSNTGVRITFAQPEGDVKYPDTTKGRVFLRRWDHRGRKKYPLSDGAIVIEQKKDELPSIRSVDIPLEDGLVVQFELPSGAEFRPGDYWLIPARAATADILWPLKPDASPNDQDRYASLPARYTKHHYNPLAHIDSTSIVTDLRMEVPPASEAV